MLGWLKGFAPGTRRAIDATTWQAVRAIEALGPAMQAECGLFRQCNLQ